MPEKPERIKRVKPAILENGAVNFGFDEVKRIEPKPVNFEELRKRMADRNRGEGQVLDTIGIETESLGLTQKEVSLILASLIEELGTNYKVHRDASALIRTYSIPMDRRFTVKVNAHTQQAEELFANSLRSEECGYELVSVPMHRTVLEMSLYALLPKLESAGDFLSDRCATHIHVGFAKNLRMMQNALILGLWFDEVFYAISGMGRKFRGRSNNAIYARPLINGPYFRYRGSYYQSLNYERALNSDNIREFFAAYGLDCFEGTPKYHPARYFSINIYSVLLHGTLEFRHFNQTFNPALASAVAKLCQVFTELAISSSQKSLQSLEPGDVFTLKKPSYYMDKLHTLLQMARNGNCEYDLDSTDINELEKIISGYTGIGISNDAVITHLDGKDIDVTSEIISVGKLRKSTSIPKPAGHTDIHNIKYSSLLNS